MLALSAAPIAPAAPTAAPTAAAAAAAPTSTPASVGTVVTVPAPAVAVAVAAAAAAAAAAGVRAWRDAAPAGLRARLRRPAPAGGRRVVCGVRPSWPGGRRRCRRAGMRAARRAAVARSAVRRRVRVPAGACLPGRRGGRVLGLNGWACGRGVRAALAS